MMVLVIGGSGSGKSAYAEKLADELAEGGLGKKALSTGSEGELAGADDGMGKGKYYFATMQALDEESRRKIKRHRKTRSGKGFFTVEQPTDIHRALEKVKAGRHLILLECISNLTANEMFSGKTPRTENEVLESVAGGVEILREAVMNLIVVSSNVFEDGIVYEEMTMTYIRAMGRINRRLAAMADRVVEVVAGIPVDL